MRWYPKGYGGTRRDPDQVKRDSWHDEGVLAVSVDDPDTEDGGDGILPGLSNIDSVRTGEYGWYGAPSSLLPHDGELTMLGGLRLSPNRRPVRSRPCSSSLLLEPLLPCASPSLPRSRHRPPA